MFDESLISDTALPGADPPAPAIAAVEPNGAKSAPENSASDIRSALAEFKQTLTDLTRKNMPEIEQVRCELQQTAAERDQAAGELKQLKRENMLKKLAENHGFSDLDYLDFILQKNNIDPAENTPCNDFMQKLKTTHPRYFISPVKSGSGSRPGNAPMQIGNCRGRMEALEMMLTAAPEVL